MDTDEILCKIFGSVDAERVAGAKSRNDHLGQSRYVVAPLFSRREHWTCYFISTDKDEHGGLVLVFIYFVVFFLSFFAVPIAGRECSD